MKDGYTLVWVGWQFDVEPPLVRVDAPSANVPGRVRFSFIPDERRTMSRQPISPLSSCDSDDPSATLTVRDRFWGTPTLFARERWQFVTEPAGRRFISTAASSPAACMRSTTRPPARASPASGSPRSATRRPRSFTHRLPVRGRYAYIFGVSQSGRFLRQFLHDGFNADERDRRVFDLVWPHIAGAGQGSFNERFAAPGYSSFPATRFPFTDLEQRDAQGAATASSRIQAGPAAESDLHGHVG